MIFKYNFQNFSKKNFFKRPILKSPFFIGLTLLSILDYTSNGDLSMFIFPLVAIPINFLFSTINYKTYMSDYHKNLIKFEPELKLLSNSNTPLGAVFHDDYLEVAGVMSSIELSGRTRSKQFFVYKQIYYTNIFSYDKNQYTTYIDFTNSSDKFLPAERLFLNYHFENSDILYEMLIKKVQACKTSSKTF